MLAKIRRDYQGTTLIELIFSLAIIGVLIALTITNFRGGGKNESARLAARVAEGIMRQAQTMTLTGVAQGGTFPGGGYGVRFDPGAPTILTLFADNNGNHVYDIGEEVAGERAPLPTSASFSLASSLDVVFSPPEGTVLFNGASAPDSQTIIFEVTGSPVTKSVIIYRLSGQVRVQ